MYQNTVRDAMINRTVTTLAATRRPAPVRRRAEGGEADASDRGGGSATMAWSKGRTGKNVLPMTWRGLGYPLIPVAPLLPQRLMKMIRMTMTTVTTRAVT